MSADTYQADPRIKQSEAVIANAFDITPESVNITTGDEVNNRSYVVREIGTDDEKYTNFVLTLRVPDSDLKPETIKAEVKEKLGALAPMKAVAQWTPEETVVESLVKDINAAISGTDFNRAFIDEPPVLKPEIVKKGWGASHKKHALSYVNSSSYGFKFGLSIPIDKDSDPKPLAEKLIADIKQRLPEIKLLLTDRVVKYTEMNLKAAGKNEAEIKQALENARANMAKLEITVNNDGGNWSAHVTVTIRSPEQIAAFANVKEAHNPKEPDNADALRATNPLHGLKDMITEKDPHPQLHKAIARSFFFGKDKKPVAIFPLVAGRMDLKTAIAKEFARILPEHPDKKEAFDKILSSEIFKERNLTTPELIKDSKTHDTVEMRLSLTEKQLTSMLEGLAALSAPVAEAPAIATATCTATAAVGDNVTTTAGEAAAIANQIIADTTQLGAALPKTEINANLAAALAGAGAAASR
ncbi:MAG: hypothetical protein KGI29_00780 [Pseudomonadota bacterium]|nr:hypothetical protein [Pseudomonadota bacterium]MDE3037323.1 hypothetical protein [Pseudomonadota bacterium]